MAASETLRTRLLSSQRSFNKYIFYDQKNPFCRMNICLIKVFYGACDTSIFCIKMYFSNEIHIFYIFIYILLCKKVFSVKRFFNIKCFFHIKTFFSANNVYFVKSENISSKIIFFQLSFATNEQP